MKQLDDGIDDTLASVVPGRWLVSPGTGKVEASKHFSDYGVNQDLARRPRNQRREHTSPFPEVLRRNIPRENAQWYEHL